MSRPEAKMCNRCHEPYLDTQKGSEYNHCASCVRYQASAEKRAQERLRRDYKPDKQTCSTCDGSGKIRGRTTSIDCPNCDGDGWNWSKFEQGRFLRKHLPGDYFDIDDNELPPEEDSVWGSRGPPR